MAYTVLRTKAGNAFLRDHRPLSPTERVTLTAHLLDDLRDDGDHLRQAGVRIGPDHFWYEVAIGDKPRVFRFAVTDAFAAFGVLLVVFGEEIT